MSQDTIHRILSRIDAPIDPIFDYDEVGLWPDGDLERMVKLGILREMAPAKSVECDGCEERCIEEVVFIDGPNKGQVRAYIGCHNREDIGRIEVPLERLNRWEADLSGFALRLKRKLNSKGGGDVVIQDRLFWIGDSRLNDQKVGVFLARGMTWSDSKETFKNAGRLQECTIALVMVPSEIPQESPFPLNVKILSLIRVLTITEDGLLLDMEEVTRAVGKIRRTTKKAIIPFPTPPGTKWNDITISFDVGNTVLIVAGSVREHKTFEEMGFADSRKMGEPPSELWSFLQILATVQGHLDWSDNVEIPDIDRTKVKKWVSDLRKKLRQYFSIAGDPFYPYRNYKAYKTKFKLDYPGHKINRR